jgi:hypothetical protein
MCAFANPIRVKSRPSDKYRSLGPFRVGPLCTATYMPFPAFRADVNADLYLLWFLAGLILEFPTFTVSPLRDCPPRLIGFFKRSECKLALWAIVANFRFGCCFGLVEEIALIFATKESSLSPAPDSRANAANFSRCVFLRFEGHSFGIKSLFLSR